MSAAKSKPLKLRDDVIETMHVCALRFDGFAWLQTKTRDGQLDFSPFMEPLMQTLTFHEDTEANFAAFFALQRCLFKWGGERLPLSAPEHTAFRFLFLHLHSLPTPQRFAHEDYEARWQSLRPHVVQEHAASVRHALLSIRPNRAVRQKAKGA